MSKESGRQDHEELSELEGGFSLKRGCLDFVLEQKEVKESGRKVEEKLQKSGGKVKC